jgi:hypothetical protein
VILRVARELMTIEHLTSMWLPEAVAKISLTLIFGRSIRTKIQLPPTVRNKSS